ncbi:MULTISPECIES: thiolase family protein [Bacillaceae]|uniref:thiolase family protein n=1 Tax=Bacillaceae TaxID=186817 RepID=UPI000BFDF3FD|nr:MULTISPECIES: acetyl-CoA C-acetyltransferase [Bacillaceae]PGT91390.1 acetyl-CoA C-acyltransferase [Bacillus sp. AFS040349]UGB31732.1 acetyl-CoA C-acetyltransferase [Metabacillus sp. B2-18]
MREVVITSAVRTPIGSFGGAFKDLLPTQLGVPVLDEVVKRSKLQKQDVEEVILGHCIQRTDEPNTARTAALLAEFPYATTGYTIQRQCASGLQAILSAAMQIQTGHSNIVIAGGVEVMSSSPYLLKQHRWGSRLQHGQVTDSVWEILEDPIHHIMMGETAENVAEEYGITRKEQDELALSSHNRALAAIESGKFAEEILPISVKTRKGENIVSQDEGPRQVTSEKLAALAPIFRENGTVTAGNASSLNDGAAALVLMSREEAEKRGLAILAKISHYTVAGVDPKVMGIGPVPAIQKGLASLNWSVQDLDVVEINEAFAAQYLAVEKQLELDREKVNVNGSGISLGHPIGCTGSRVVVSLLHEMQRREAQKGLASLCVGGGIGVALFIERD